MDAPTRTTWTRTLTDVVFAVAVAVAAVGVQLSGSEAVDANRPVDALTVGLTLCATLPLAVRRRRPVTVLAVTSAAAVLMALTKTAVGLSTIGPLVAFYSAIAFSDRRRGRAAVAIVVGIIALTAVIQPVDLSGEGALVNLICLGFAGTLGAGVRERRERHDADVAAAEQRAELERRLAVRERERADAVAVEERLRLTRELHDVIGHALSVMVVQAGVAERMLERRPDEARTAVARIARTGRDSLGEMRRLLEVLRQGDSTLVASRHPAPTLEDLVELVAEVRDAGMDVTLDETGPRDDLPAGLQLATYRIVQEALTNCLKHSSGHHVAVRVDRRGDAVEIEVVDDGRPRRDVVPGHGITGMRERVAFYGGTLDAAARDDGFAVRAVLPVAHETQPEVTEAAR